MELPPYAEFMTFRNPETKQFLSIPTDQISREWLMEARAKTLLPKLLVGEDDPQIYRKFNGEAPPVPTQYHYEYSAGKYAITEIAKELE